MQNQLIRPIGLLSARNLPSLSVSGREGESPAGFLTRSDALGTLPGQRGLTRDGQPLADVYAELTERNAAFNSTMSSLTALLTYPVFRATDKIAVPSSNGFEVATEFGQPTKRRVVYVTRGFPLTHYDTGMGYTQEFIDDSTGRDIIAVQDGIEVDWTRLEMTVILSALFNNANAGDDDGVLVKRLYNADGEVPPSWKRYSHSGSHTHYLTDAAFDADSVQVMETHLVHHGFDGQLWLFVHNTDISKVRASAGYVPAVGADRAAVVDGQIIGGSRPTQTPTGSAVQGYIGKFAVVIEDEVPPGYFLGLATSGVLSARNVVGLRFHENPAARGLRLVQGPRQDYPLYDAFYDGYLGAGVRQRGAAVVLQETAGAYAVPTFS